MSLDNEKIETEFLDFINIKYSFLHQEYLDILIKLFRQQIMIIREEVFSSSKKLNSIETFENCLKNHDDYNFSNKTYEENIKDSELNKSLNQTINKEESKKENYKDYNIGKYINSIKSDENGKIVKEIINNNNTLVNETNYFIYSNNTTNSTKTLETSLDIIKTLLEDIKKIQISNFNKTESKINEQKECTKNITIYNIYNKEKNDFNVTNEKAKNTLFNTSKVANNNPYKNENKVYFNDSSKISKLNESKEKEKDCKLNNTLKAEESNKIENNKKKEWPNDTTFKTENKTKITNEFNENKEQKVEHQGEHVKIFNYSSQIRNDTHLINKNTSNPNLKNQNINISISNVSKTDISNISDVSKNNTTQEASEDNTTNDSDKNPNEDISQISENNTIYHYNNQTTFPVNNQTTEKMNKISNKNNNQTINITNNGTINQTNDNESTSQQNQETYKNPDKITIQQNITKPINILTNQASQTPKKEYPTDNNTIIQINPSPFVNKSQDYNLTFSNQTPSKDNDDITFKNLSFEAKNNKTKANFTQNKTNITINNKESPSKVNSLDLFDKVKINPIENSLIKSAFDSLYGESEDQNYTALNNIANSITSLKGFSVDKKDPLKAVVDKTIKSLETNERRSGSIQDEDDDNYNKTIISELTQVYLHNRNQILKKFKKEVVELQQINAMSSDDDTTLNYNKKLLEIINKILDQFSDEFAEDQEFFSIEDVIKKIKYLRVFYIVESDGIKQIINKISNGKEILAISSNILSAGKELIKIISTESRNFNSTQYFANLTIMEERIGSIESSGQYLTNFDVNMLTRILKTQSRFLPFIESFKQKQFINLAPFLQKMKTKFQIIDKEIKEKTKKYKNIKNLNSLIFNDIWTKYAEVAKTTKSIFINLKQNMQKLKHNDQQLSTNKSKNQTENIQEDENDSSIFRLDKLTITLIYYFIVFILVIIFLIIFKKMINYSLIFLQNMNYSPKSKRNQTIILFYMTLTPLVLFIFGMILYPGNILIEVIFAINGELLAGAIMLHSDAGRPFGNISFLILSFFLSWRLTIGYMIIFKIILICLGMVVFFLIGDFISVKQIIEWEEPDLINSEEDEEEEENPLTGDEIIRRPRLRREN
jgi:hypothetical protein